MGQPHSAPQDTNHPINLFIPPYPVPVVLPHSKRNSIKEETTATLTELQGSDDATDSASLERGPSQNTTYLAKPSDWILVDLESLSIIRSAYAAEMVVGGGNYLVVSARGLAMKEVNPSQIGRAMMEKWEGIKVELMAAYLSSATRPSESEVEGDKRESEDCIMHPGELFSGREASISGSVREAPDWTADDAPDTAFSTPDSSDQGSDSGLLD